MKKIEMNYSFFAAVYYERVDGDRMREEALRSHMKSAVDFYVQNRRRM